MTRLQHILSLFHDKSGFNELSSSEIHRGLEGKNENISLVTVKRELSSLEKEGYIESIGQGRSTAYRMTNKGRLLMPVDVSVHLIKDPDKRGHEGYNFELFKNTTFDIFSTQELDTLEKATAYYRQKIQGVSDTINQKELERFVIELSWKSSKIEGNTYTLLDTEKLLVNHLEAPGHSHEEAVMILNHKKAFYYIIHGKQQFKLLNRKIIEEVHSLLVEDLNVARNIRLKPVGVTGSAYRPLDNEYQLAEALQDLCDAVNRTSNEYTKALLIILGISYLQPFEDGNKRTARLLGNAILIAYNFSPLSYRSVDEFSYREAMLVFYELNSIMPFKKIFIEQYEFSAHNYTIHV